MTARSTDEIVAEMEYCAKSDRYWSVRHLLTEAADRLKTQQHLLTLAEPATIGDELLALLLLAIEGRAREVIAAAEQFNRCHP
jgi:hypothetical protein